MKKSKNSQDAVVIPSPDCGAGYTIEQVETIMGARIDEFNRWMNGQTMCLCEGRRYDHTTREYKIDEVCAGVAHGPVVYAWDLKRFLEVIPGKEIWD